MTELTNFFKESDTSFGVFYPKHYIVATFPSIDDTKAAYQALRNAGFPDDEIRAVPGEEAVEFFREFRAHTGLWGAVMGGLSKSFGTEAIFEESDMERARHGAGFLAIRSLTDAESARIVDSVKPFSPVTIQWYLSGGIRSLI